ncbi:MAG: FecR family protein [Bacteroidales bacterium]|jgi:ferric-dicitrate binding protein FerR (iron transport regulator)|nr:FecR family protein [Bacteroidales bacterium]MCI1784813.1 FecR family protein [Bacteroidales bacterium]
MSINSTDSGSNTEIIKIISRYARQTATEEEEKTLLAWIEESEENKRFFANIMANFSLHETISTKDLQKDSGEMLLRLNTRIDAEEENLAEKKTKSRYLKFFLGAAAAAAVVFAVFFFRASSFSWFSNENMSTAFNDTGDIELVNLDDGTKVWLKPGSEIDYNVLGKKGKRFVQMCGEAYFDVAKNPECPFIIKTSNIGIRVLGTAFSVKTFQTGSEVVLERGSVRILSPKGAGMVTMSPNQKALFNASTGDIKIEPVYASSFITQQYNLIAMYDATIPEIIRSVERRFDVSIGYEYDGSGKMYNVCFLKTDSLGTVMSIIEYMTGIRMEVKTKTSD